MNETGIRHENPAFAATSNPPQTNTHSEITKTAVDHGHTDNCDHLIFRGLGFTKFNQAFSKTLVSFEARFRNDQFTFFVPNNADILSLASHQSPSLYPLHHHPQRSTSQNPIIFLQRSPQRPSSQQHPMATTNLFDDHNWLLAPIIIQSIFSIGFTACVCSALFQEKPTIR